MGSLTIGENMAIWHMNTAPIAALLYLICYVFQQQLGLGVGKRWGGFFDKKVNININKNPWSRWKGSRLPVLVSISKRQQFL